MGLFPKSVKVLLDGILFPQRPTALLSFGVIFKLAEGAFNPTVLLTNISNRVGPNTHPGGTVEATTRYNYCKLIFVKKIHPISSLHITFQSLLIP